MRPTLYKYATTYALSGFVKNTTAGVILEIQGDSAQVSLMIEKIKLTPPPLAKIESMDVQYIDCIENEMTFSILTSENPGAKTALISPDLATCPDCLAEIFDSKDRRYRYPFTNCTNCGPRFTIIKDRPYDRALTSMHSFKMCADCEREYNDPTNRRFHAQPNACPVCGPKLSLLGITSGEGPLSATVDFLKKGKIGAIKGLGGFNIACDPFNPTTLQRLRSIKNRPHRSFAVMMKDIRTVERYCEVSPEEKTALESPSSPIVLLRKKTSDLDALSPDNNYIGAMLPYTPVHHLIFESLDVLVMTSANFADEPIVINERELAHLFEVKAIDFALTHNRDILHRCDDSILQFISGECFPIRLGRGFTPAAMKVTGSFPSPVLAFGADLKNTFSLASGSTIHTSQHIGDLGDVRNLDYQQEQILDLSHLLDISPKTEVCDAHPGYQTYSTRRDKVFHHHAHALSVLAEKNLLGTPVTAVICDGTGFGTDGKIWGFEIFKIGSNLNAERFAHLDYFLLPGGEKAVTEVDRIATALMHASGLPVKNKTSLSLIEKGINSPETSSLGRLFDGISALIGLTQISEYEARAAILLQQCAENFYGTPNGEYEIDLRFDSCWILEYKNLIISIVDDLKNKIPKEEIAWKFHSWIASGIAAIVEKSGTDPIVLSGGCFQNTLLTKMVMSRAKTKYHFPRHIPVNDACISIGQAFSGVEHVSRNSR
jgi:hydrogenase maturation protein HypF